ncbi:hypothetical protein Q9S36_36475 [Microbacterium sp. ARD31]|uniref:hypothetical protein n=1 Tax=Microbacterium sp. ARD31 TaxID=2962576 RepID=UPI002881039C|nr:hypothetical protein [Microbacterium sp. ARD31]MDT0185697.1 hypothetical protein [Microbacterium sp. ARD31]
MKSEDGDPRARPSMIDWVMGGLMFLGLAITLHILFGLASGSTADWVTAIATVAALAAAAQAAQVAWQQLRMQQRSAAELAAERDAAQAGLVAGWVSVVHVARNVSTGRVVAFTGLDVTLRNASDLPVYQLQGWIRDRKTGGSLAEAPFSIQVLEPSAEPVSEKLSMPTGTMLSVEVFGEIDEEDLPSQFHVEFEFRDSLGRWWHRGGLGRLTRSEMTATQGGASRRESANQADTDARALFEANVNRVNQNDADQHLAGVDRAALVFAASAGAVTLATGNGAWTAFSSFVGLLLLVLVLGFHRSMPQLRSIRALVMRLAFGGTVTLCLYIVASWPLQETWADIDQAPAGPALAAMVGVSIVIAALEGAISRFLNWTF